MTIYMDFSRANPAQVVKTVCDNWHRAAEQGWTLGNDMHEPWTLVFTKEGGNPDAAAFEELKTTLGLTGFPVKGWND